MIGFEDIEGDELPTPGGSTNDGTLPYNGTGIGSAYTSPEHDGSWRGQDSSWNEAYSLPDPTYLPPY